MKAQKDKGAKAKRKKNSSYKKDEESGASGAQKDFSINVNDDRFSRMMEGDARFGIDPLAPEFKDTDAMRTIMGEQKLRRKQREKSGKTKRNDPTRLAMKRRVSVPKWMFQPERPPERKR